ncbi:hypothetical protein [Sulfurospirillum barnesii]|uniref:Uncharacterized protein n=1 Tax=Sulfurospirillum barnesii (strain ATCC 700032 / DSM 10660 / SES-3) TaxID=760154 RepID=I3XWQ9_SULBS|nr:hypothetical protein [Sulfurospirillum barnesii]AFL68383.1 hypothetical protein Sulba_1087 [Sulfurospirillum barnesii SES-3]
MAFLRALWIGVFFGVLSYAQTPEQELIAKVLKLLVVENSTLRVYENQPAISLQGSSFDALVSTCEQASLIYGENFEVLSFTCKALPRFSTNYDVFKNDTQVIGAFYWRKGRPQLRFNKERCEAFHILLPQELVRYVE